MMSCHNKWLPSVWVNARCSASEAQLKEKRSLFVKKRTFSSAPKEALQPILWKPRHKEGRDWMDLRPDLSWIMRIWVYGYNQSSCETRCHCVMRHKTPLLVSTLSKITLCALNGFFFVIVGFVWSPALPFRRVWCFTISLRVVEIITLGAPFLTPHPWVFPREQRHQPFLPKGYGLLSGWVTTLK